MAKRIRLCDDALIHELFQEESSDEDDFVENDSDDGEEDIVEEEIHDSDAEEAVQQPDEESLDIDEDDGDDVPLANVYLVRDKDRNVMKWAKSPPLPRNVRTRAENIIVRLPGTKGEAREKFSEIECFNLFMDDKLIRLIVTSTNIYINLIREKFQRDRDARMTDDVEIRAFLGILFISGALGSSRKKTKFIWDNSKGSGVECCYLAMSEKRFHFLMRCLRFDDYRDRQQRREIDRLAPIRELFELIIQNFQTFFTPSEFCTVDEQLIAFRGKCPFRMYMPKKPARYGIKVYALVCAKTMYTVNLEIYAGTQPNGPYKTSNSSEDVTMRMVEPISSTNRNVTIDNWFTSVSLAEKLLKEKN
ncbi:piggyBac transposable element-derived protein 4-like [Nilaparvata lugens]|uniref:piggyBac transposable element-derived protein 4-like n=1 Tax=Nilaparvata lugens TaxID=108931 RepID=UPI00193DB3D7|nr:piggyBac transposable element-derived protein 4-like [Nilaparvata lugens]XP_022193858.2 piggyBac transposable element-derived protein 4-like [Nilaparvata lugens]